MLNIREELLPKYKYAESQKYYIFTDYIPKLRNNEKLRFRRPAHCVRASNILNLRIVNFFSISEIHLYSCIFLYFAVTDRTKNSNGASILKTASLIVASRRTWLDETM